MDGRERVAEFGRELREGPEPSDRSIKEIIDALRPQVQELVAKQVELAQTELTPVAKRGGLAAGLLAAAGVFMLVFLIIFSLTGVWALNVFGIRPAVWFSYVAGAGLMVPLVIFIVVPYFTGDWHSSNMTWAIPSGWGGFKLAMVYLFLMAWSS